MTANVATTPTVGYWQTKLAAAVGSARPSDIEASRLEWTNRARDLRTVQETLVQAIPDIRNGLNTESGVESVRAMRRAAGRAVFRAERMEHAAAALTRVRDAIEAAEKVLSPLEQTEVYEPLKGPPPVDGWESPKGIKAAANFHERRRAFEKQTAEREEAARLALTELNSEFLAAGRTLENTHSGRSGPPPVGELAAVSFGGGGAFAVVRRLEHNQGPARRRPPDGATDRRTRNRGVGLGEGHQGDERPVSTTPIGTTPIGTTPIDAAAVMKAVPPPTFSGDECGDLPAEGEAPALGAETTARGGLPNGPVAGGGLPGGIGAPLGGLMAGGLFYGLSRGSVPAKPLEPTPLSKDAAAANAKAAGAAGGRPLAAAPYTGRGGGMGMGMGMGGAGGGGAGGRGGHSAGRRAFGNLVQATPRRRGERDRRNAFEREEEREEWLGEEGAGTGVLG